MVDDPGRASVPPPVAPSETSSDAVTPTLHDSNADLRPAPAPPSVSLPEAGYKIGNLIGRGGMGEVLAAHDTRIGRDVAVKRMRNPRPNQEALVRFLREARIQARLDHPSIVPVHELGTDDAGRPYFTMKRCAGVTLARLIASGGSLHRLLRAFVDVCLAVEFAHSRGVVHRDLKPANIMLGDYGEVYVLDWGVARVLADGPDDPGSSIQPSDETPSPEDSTKSGALLGTPGYIAPEQIEGDAPAPPVDAYALGCILFEILACEPLHPRGEPAIGRTLSTPQDSPARRRPDRQIPPELDAVCFEALAMDPAQRPTPRELADRVQAYLDGDRDLERRKTLAAEQLATAREALERAGDAPEARVDALQAAGRALALDPESTEATELVGGLLLEPPPVEPPDLVRSLDEHERRANRDRSRKSMFAYLSVIVLFPLVLALDVKNWTLIGAFYGAIGLGLVASYFNYRSGKPAVPAVLAVNLAVVVLFTRVAGPFVLTPLVICCLVVGIIAIPWLNKHAGILLAYVAIVVMLPFVFEWLHVLPGTWSISSGAMMIQSDVFQTHGTFDEVSLVSVNLLFTLVVALLALGISRRQRRSERALLVHAWHLRHLVGPIRSWASQAP